MSADAKVCIVGWMFRFQHDTAFAHSQLQLINHQNPFLSFAKSESTTHSKTSHSTTPTTLQIYDSNPTTQKDKQKPISPSALNMAPTPFTSLPFVFVTLLSILHLSHCKTLKRDGNISYLTQSLHPCHFLSTFLQFDQLGCRLLLFPVMGRSRLCFPRIFCSQGFERDQGFSWVESGVCVGR